MTPETRVVLANCAGSFLLLIAFLLLILVSALLLLFVRGLWLARNASPEQLARLHGVADRARQQTTDTATSVIDPQIQLASTWTGIKAGVRVFLGASPASPSIAEVPESVDGLPDSQRPAPESTSRTLQSSQQAQSRMPVQSSDQRHDGPSVDSPGQSVKQSPERLPERPPEQPPEQKLDQQPEKPADKPAEHPPDEPA